MATGAMWRSSRSTTCPMARRPRREPLATSAASSRRANETNRMRFGVRQIDLFERDVRLRMPFRFGIVTLTESPQAFGRVRIRLENGVEAEGAAAELLAPKWFDKNPALSNEDNFEQLRQALALAKGAYLGGGSSTAFGHFEAHYRTQIERCAARGL